MKTENDENNKHAHLFTDTTRILALTDGVFAIVMTILVLEIKIPDLTITDAAMVRHLVEECAYELLLFAIGFLLSGVYWIAHRMIFCLVKKVNTTLVWLNIIFLMFCSLIPFGTALLGTQSHHWFALKGYGILLTLLASWRLIMYAYVTSHHELTFVVVPSRQRNKVMLVMAFAPIMFSLSLSIVHLFPKVTLILYAITPPMFVAAITYVNHPKRNKLAVPSNDTE